jgi:plastocyanin
MIRNVWLPSFANKLAPADPSFVSEKDYRDAFVDVAADDFFSEGKAYAAPLSVDSLATSTPAMATSTKAFTITGKNYSFDPKTITVKKGDLVKITLKNSGGTHDLKIDEFKVATAKLTNGQSATVEFTADKKGTFEYYCSVGNHRAMGMVGKLIVE